MKSYLSLTRLLTIFGLAASLFIVSCKKEASVDTPVQQVEFASATAEADAEAETIFDDVFDNVAGVDAEVGIGGTGVFGSANNYGGGIGQEILSGAAGIDTGRCFTVTYTQLNAPARFPLRVVLDFGTGCTGRDGRTRKGKIIIEYTGPLFVPGKSSTTTFDGYYVNDNHVEGVHKVLNTSTSNTRSFRILVTGAKITRPDGNYSEWNSEKNITQIEGLGTPLFPLDDWFKIEGGANGSVKRTDKFFQWSTVISEPLIKKFTCRWLVKGIVTMRKSNAPVATLDYGDGTCDNKAVITVNGVAKEITLR